MKLGLCTLMLLLVPFAAEEGRAGTGRLPANEPFRTFELVDTKLQEMAKTQEQLRRAVSPADFGKATSIKPHSRDRAWTLPARTLQGSANTIEKLAARQERRYAGLKQPFGVRAFRALGQKASEVGETARVIASTQEDGRANALLKSLDQRAMALVLQYQALSGGYGSLRCTGEQSPCCEPKEEKADGNYPACRWMCSAQKACKRGFSGPKTPRAKF